MQRARTRQAVGAGGPGAARRSQHPLLRAICATLGLGLLALLVLCQPSIASARDDDDDTSRELGGIAEEQDLLRRQLQRLHQTMIVLSDRLEAEGRTHAVELLQDGIRLLEERPESAESLTLEEVMERSRGQIEGGQVVSSIETQVAVIGRLEHLLSILMDRESLESLEENLEELRELQADLGQIAEEERELREDTAGLRNEISNDAQRELEQGIASAIREQRQLLERNEAEGRESGVVELEQYAEALRELLERQQTDASVLESWDPSELVPLETAREAADAARAEESRTSRMRRPAASVLPDLGAAEVAGSRAHSLR